jgi:hypothetical protein
MVISLSIISMPYWKGEDGGNKVEVNDIGEEV